MMFIVFNQGLGLGVKHLSLLSHIANLQTISDEYKLPLEGRQNVQCQSPGAIHYKQTVGYIPVIIYTSFNIKVTVNKINVRA